LMFPVAAGPARGPRFARLLVEPKARLATRNIKAKPAHRLDERALSTNNNENEACSLVVNIFGSTRLRFDLQSPTNLAAVGDALEIDIAADVLVGSLVGSRTLARSIAPAVDIAAIVASVKPADIPKSAILKDSKALRFDPAKVLASLERKSRGM